MYELTQNYLETLKVVEYDDRDLQIAGFELCKVRIRVHLYQLLDDLVSDMKLIQADSTYLPNKRFEGVLDE